MKGESEFLTTGFNLSSARAIYSSDPGSLKEVKTLRQFSFATVLARNHF